MKVGDKFTIIPPNNHIVDTVRKIIGTEVWGDFCAWDMRDCIPLTLDQAEVMLQRETFKQENLREKDSIWSWLRRLAV